MSSSRMRRRSSRHDRRWKILYASVLLVTAILILAALIQPYLPDTQRTIYGQWSPTGNSVENTGPLQNAPSAEKGEPSFAADRNFPTGRELINILIANHPLHLAITFVLIAAIIRNAWRSSSISTIARLERDAAQQELIRLKKEFSIISENSHSFLFRTDKQGPHLQRQQPSSFFGTETVCALPPKSAEQTGASRRSASCRSAIF